jgi:mRNA interferase MazF
VRRPERGEVWVADLGFAAKVRPALVLSVQYGDNDRALVSLVPHTTSVRGTQFEVPILARFLKPGAFDAQGLVTVPPPRLLQRLGALGASELQQVEVAVARWLGIG